MSKDKPKEICRFCGEEFEEYDDDDATTNMCWICEYYGPPSDIGGS